MSDQKLTVTRVHVCEQVQKLRAHGSQISGGARSSDDAPNLESVNPQGAAGSGSATTTVGDLPPFSQQLAGPSHPLEDPSQRTMYLRGPSATASGLP